MRCIVSSKIVKVTYFGGQFAARTAVHFDRSTPGGLFKYLLGSSADSYSNLSKP